MNRDIHKDGLKLRADPEIITRAPLMLGLVILSLIIGAVFAAVLVVMGLKVWIVMLTYPVCASVALILCAMRVNRTDRGAGSAATDTQVSES